MKTNLVLFLQFAGVIHLGLLCAGLLMPRAVSMRSHVATLPPFLGRLFWVYYGFIALCLASFGALSFFLAPQLASGSALARAVCAFLALFWTTRLFVSAFVLDVRPYLTNAFWKTGYHATNLVFVVLPAIYGWAAVAGGQR